MTNISVELIPEMDAEYAKLRKDAKEDFLAGKRKSFNIQLLKAVDRTLDNLKWNPNLGQNIPKKNIPAVTLKKYGVENLWRVELPSYWRLLYTVTIEES